MRRNVVISGTGILFYCKKFSPENSEIINLRHKLIVQHPRNLKFSLLESESSAVWHVMYEIDFAVFFIGLHLDDMQTEFVKLACVFQPEHKTFQDSVCIFITCKCNVLSFSVSL
jgi:hypothetical protein